MLTALTRDVNSGTENGIVKVWNMTDDEPISRFRNTAVSRSSYAGGHPIVSMQFHPHEMTLGVGATDAKLNVSPEVCSLLGRLGA